MLLRSCIVAIDSLGASQIETNVFAGGSARECLLASGDKHKNCPLPGRQPQWNGWMQYICSRSAFRVIRLC